MALKKSHAIYTLQYPSGSLNKRIFSFWVWRNQFTCSKVTVGVHWQQERSYRTKVHRS